MIPYRRKVSIRKRVFTGIGTLLTAGALTAPLIFPVKIGEFGIELFWVLAGLFIFAETVTVVLLLKLHKLTPYELTANLISVWQFTVWIVRVLLALVWYIVSYFLGLAFRTVYGIVGVALSIVTLPITLIIDAIQGHKIKKEERKTAAVKE